MLMIIDFFLNMDIREVKSGDFNSILCPSEKLRNCGLNLDYLFTV